MRTAFPPLMASVLTLAACGAAAPSPPDGGATDAAVPFADARPATPALVDGRFTERQWATLRRMTPVPRAPPNPTNRYADDPRAAALGGRFFEDAGFSRDGRVACVTCHRRERLFTDGLPVAVAQEPPQRGRRNTPTLLYAAWGRWKLWDGGADTLWAQPILALENPREHATTRLAVAHRVATAYRAGYESVFGPLPPLDDARRFPRDGKPGDASWDAMAAEDQSRVLRVVANVGKALEAFERTLVAPPSAFDRYVAGDLDAMTPRARDGLALFLALSCVNCHSGPLFTDDDFHALRVPDDAQAGADRGRLEGLATAAANPLGARGEFSDDPQHYPPREAATAARLGEFRTPTLRGVALTAPYGHAGTLPTLRDVILHDAAGGLPPGDPRAQGAADLALVPFAPTPAEVDALVAFLEALTPDGPAPR